MIISTTTRPRILMSPTVKGKKFPYTSAGKMAAKMARKMRKHKKEM